MTARASIFLLCLSASLSGAIPTPREHFGFSPGDDYKLAGVDEIHGYFQKLTLSSDRIRWVEFGKSSNGKPMCAAFISDASNLARLDHYRETGRRLALGLDPPEEARSLAQEGKAIVWIDSGLHASEVAPAQHAPELAYRMIADSSAEAEAIRRNVILIQIPVINPDGLDWIVQWYRRNVGTPYELAPLPWLYQKYAGHDNNRDYYMLNLTETRHVTGLLFQQWFPQIVYNQHQTPAFPARIFVPPYADPLNPNIPAAVMEGISLIGTAMKERFARENKSGVVSYMSFDGWWNGGLRSVPAFHNMHGILTETALYQYATPRVYKDSDIPKTFPNGMPAREPTIFYPRPWLGGKWTVRDAIEYMLTADFAILELAAARRSDFLLKSYQMAKQSIETGEKSKPYAYLIPPEQWDPPTAVEILERLSLAGIEVRRSRAPFRVHGKSYPEGTFVLLTAQAFRSYLVDLMEPQRYPEIRISPGAAPKRPYDITGWTLSMLMGVNVERAEEPFTAELETLAELPKPLATRPLNHQENSSFLATSELLDQGKRVAWASDGEILVEGTDPIESLSKARYELRRPRLALYQPWVANMDQGWTAWVLDRYRIPHTLIHNDDFQGSDLAQRFDTILLASQSLPSILHGHRHGEAAGEATSGPRLPTVQRPEYAGGIGLAGAARLERFVREGGTLIALDAAIELPIQLFPLPVRNVLRGSGAQTASSAQAFFCPGSILRFVVDTSHPIAFGMPREITGFYDGGEALESTLAEQHNQPERKVTSVVTFAKSNNLLASGWVQGERAVGEKGAVLEVSFGKGKVVLFALRPQFRAQTYGTFKLLLNAIYLGSAKSL